MNDEDNNNVHRDALMIMLLEKEKQTNRQAEKRTFLFPMQHHHICVFIVKMKIRGLHEDFHNPLYFYFSKVSFPGLATSITTLTPTIFSAIVNFQMHITDKITKEYLNKLKLKRKGLSVWLIYRHNKLATQTVRIV